MSIVRSIAGSDNVTKYVCSCSLLMKPITRICTRVFRTWQKKKVANQEPKYLHLAKGKKNDRWKKTGKRYEKWKLGKIYGKYEKSILGKKLSNGGKVFEERTEKSQCSHAEARKRVQRVYKSFSQLCWKFLLKCRSNVYTSFDIGNFSNKLLLTIISRNFFACVRDAPRRTLNV